MPEFSVIVPIYKVEPYLPQCIDSILAQTYADFELILVDDGSPDNCGKICDAYAAKDTRIQVIHKPNGGLVSARKAGVQRTNGEYILYVDGDDYIGVDHLKAIHDVIEEYNPDMVAFGFTLVRDDSTITRTFVNDLPDGKLYSTQEKGFYDGLVYNRKKGESNQGILFPSIWAKAARREIIAPHILSVPDEIVMGEDVAMTNAALCDCRTVYVSSACGYRYRSNASSMTNTFRRDMLRRRSALFQFMNSHLDKIPQANKDAYACQQIIGHIIGAVRDFDRYGEFKKYIQSEMTPELHAIVDRCETPKLPWKHKILFIMLKRYAYGGFWMLYHVLKKH